MIKPISLNNLDMPAQESFGAKYIICCN